MGANAEFWPFKASAAIAAFTIVKGTSNAGEAAPATAATDKILGVCDSVAATVAGQAIDVATEGVHKVVAGAAFDAGDPLTSDASGRAIRATFTSGQMKHVVGFALQPAIAAGDIVIFSVSKSVIAG
jgi:hypothetical protein